jgi:transcription termination factor Rho
LTTRQDLEGRHLAELHELASAQRVPRFRTLTRPELVEAILDAGPDSQPAEELADRERDQERPAQTEAEPEPTEVRGGVLDLVPDGYGFLRTEGLGRSDDDVYVSRSLVKQLGLRSGDELAGPVRPPGRSSRFPGLLEASEINGNPAEDFGGDERPSFDELTPIPPGERIQIASGPDSLATRMVDLIAPMGRGQRGLIASPAGAGATTLLQELARGLGSATGTVPVVVLVDVRPEEITAWRRTVDGPVYGTSSDSSPEAHVRLAELALERSRRLIERGHDVVLLLDSLTRLARARSLQRGRSRRQPRSDDDTAPAENPAIRSAKRWFSAARNTEEQGSLTIVGIVRVEGDSEFEQLVYEVLMDSANMELRLDRDLAQAGHFPPLDVNRSWSHLEAATMDADEAAWLAALRRSLISLTPEDAWRAVTERLLATSSNAELIQR